MNPRSTQRPRRSRRRQLGQSMVEYLVAGAVVFGIFWLPYNGTDGDPLIVVFVQAVSTAFDNFSAAASLP